MGNAQQSASAASSILNEASSSLTSASGLVCGSIADALDDKPSSSSKKKNSSNNNDDSNNRSTSPMLILPSEFCNSNTDTLSPVVSKQQLHKKQQSANSNSNHNNNKSDANDNNDNDDGNNKINPTSALFARALISEVTDNPHTMSPEAMAAREKRLLQAQNKDRKTSMTKIMDTLKYHLEGVGVTSSTTPSSSTQPVASPSSSSRSMSYPPNQLSENRAQLGTSSSASTFPSPDYDAPPRPGTHTITIGLSLSRRHSTVGHPDTVTRQTAFDFNELQDRNYKYVSSTDASGWRAGGGEKGGQSQLSSLQSTIAPLPLPLMSGDDHQSTHQHKIASPDTVHIPILQIDADSPAVVDQIIGALARGEVFIPHMSVLPEALSVNGVSPPDLIVRFGCERNDDLPPEEWPNWTLEFMHNQLYDYFSNLGARWMKRPFQITLAKKVRWRTVKHMNKFFAHSERVISAWREKGPQYLNPQLSYIEGGATPEEVARPHGIYLLRDGRPTNYFAPNFEPPYTTKMTRSLILNVLDKSWDKKRRDWNSLPPAPRIVPGLLLGAVCGCEMRGVDSPQAISTSSSAAKENIVRLGMTEAVMQREGSGGAANPTTDSTSSVTSRNNSSPHNKKSSSQSNNNGSSGSRSSPRGSPVQADQQLSSKHNNRSSQQQQQQQQQQQPPSTESTSDTNNENKNHRVNNSNSPENKIKSSKDDKKKKKKKHSKQHQIDTSPSTPPKNNDPATMDMSSSIGESHTTIPISNASPRLLEREREKRKQRELEMRKEREKMEKIEEAIRKRKEGQVTTTTTTKEEMEQSGSDNKSGRKKKEKKSRQKSSKQQQQQRRSATPPPSSNYVSPVSHCTTDDQSHFTFESATSSQNNSNKHHHHRVNSGGSIPLIRSHSQNSLEYSVDDSLSIGRFRSDASVATNNTANQSLLSYVTRSTIHDDGSSSAYHHHSKTTTTTTTSSRKDFLLGDDDDDDDYKNDDVPSDEELFAIGWAKALDANSGSYYYFTLDRSKIVWENPLAGDVPHLMGSSGSSSVGLRT